LLSKLPKAETVEEVKEYKVVEEEPFRIEKKGIFIIFRGRR